MSKFNNKKHRRLTALLLCVALMLGSVTSVSADISAADSETEVQSEAQTYTEEPTTEAVSYGAPEAQTEVQEGTPVAEETEAPAADTQQTEAHTEAATEAHTETAAETQAAETTETEVETETETEVVAQQLEYEDDQVKVHVTASEEGIIPDHASLKVVPLVKQEVTNEMTDEQKQEVEAINKKYDEAEKKLTEKAEKEAYDIAGFLAYDISLVDADGNKVEPNGDVKVTMDYKQPVIAEDAVQTVNDTEGIDSTKDLDVTVLHLEEDNKGKVTDVVDMTADDTKGNAEIDTTAENEIQKITITTDSFSTFVITYSDSSAQITVKYVNEKGEELTSTTEFTDTTVKLKKNNDEVKFVSGSTDKVKIPATVQIGDKTYAYIASRLDSVTGQNVYSIKYDKDQRQWKDKQFIDKSYKAWNEGKGGAVYIMYQVQETLSTVPTIDSKAKGITIRMIDFDGEKNKSLTRNGRSIEIGGLYGNGTIKSGLLDSKLDANGYPVVKQGNKNLSVLFEDGNDAIDANHLFRSDIYNTTGDFEYSSFNNYAYLNQDSGNFTLYNQIGTPSDEQAYFYQRGNFFPYNEIENGKYSTNTNLYDEDGHDLATTDLEYNKKLYKTQGVNYLFGMYIEANFVQPKDGITTKTDQNMRYEFNGDDDMWIYIDGILALDIGGVHDAHSGYIDFATGEIGWYDCKTNETAKITKSSIKEQFRNAGYFPDGSRWNDKDADKYFTGNTFKDYSTHTFKMFYMERGGGASNLHMKFNLEVIPEGTIEVEKQLTNTDKQKYSDVEFGFRVYAQKIANKEANGVETYKDTYVPLTDAVYNKGNRTGRTVTAETVTYDGVPYDNVFKLKPDESIQISGLQKNRKYYVEEVGVQASQYDKITINGKDYVDKDGTIIDWSEGSATVGSRPYVICQNNCSAANSRELLITKQMANGQTTNDTFNFKIQLSNDHNELVPYANGDYYLFRQTEKGRVYYYYQDGQLVENAELESGQENSENTKAIVCGKTDEKGMVYGVPVGYTVAITGILSSTSFKVTEENLNEDLYKTPEKGVTDAGKSTISDADGVIKLGGNAKVTITNSLKERMQVKKLWSGTAATPDTTVYVGLYKDGNPRGQYLALNEDNNFEGLFEGLDDGTYTVKELRVVKEGERAEFTIGDTGYIGVSDGDSVAFDNTVFKVIYGEKTRDTTDQGLSKVQITNAAAWQLRKISSNSTDETKLGLADAEFTLVKGDTTIYAKSYEDGFVKFYKYKNFTTEVKYLKDGIYTVTEVKAPTGYALNSTGWTVVVENGVVNGMTAGSASVTSYTENGVTTFDMTNTPIYNLPNSGGSGIYWFSICGMLLMMAAAWIIYKNKCREVLVK
ncbi:MAG: SpaA isopeptide-forming pilin-related protein [Coprococcus catus]|nr:SpaA isopeptide-forming pilin-related protein [Coprococcus catus]